MKSYYIHQKVTAFANQYRIYEDENGQQGKLIAFAHQKRLSFKEKFIFFTDETKQQVAVQVQAQKVLELAAGYDVKDEQERVIGILQKQFKSSLLRSTWQIQRPDNREPIAVVRERNEALAVFRRVWGFLPFLSELPFFIRYHFDFVKPGTEQVVARYNKTTRFFDHYKLEIEDELLSQVDVRVLIAQGVALDALQSR